MPVEQSSAEAQKGRRLWAPSVFTQTPQNGSLKRVRLAWANILMGYVSGQREQYSLLLSRQMFSGLPNHSLVSGYRVLPWILKPDEIDGAPEVKLTSIWMCAENQVSLFSLPIQWTISCSEPALSEYTHSHKQMRYEICASIALNRDTN